MKIPLLRNIAAALLLTAFGASIASAEDTHAFPNPFVAQKSTLGTIAFTPLPNSGTINIYTLDGLEIRSIDIPPGGLANWDTKNANGKNVASGVYYFRVNGGGQETVGKLVIIR
jgi:hypothetical protein